MVQVDPHRVAAPPPDVLDAPGVRLVDPDARRALDPQLVPLLGESLLRALRAQDVESPSTFGSPKMQPWRSGRPWIVSTRRITGSKPIERVAERLVHEQLGRAGTRGGRSARRPSRRRSRRRPRPCSSTRAGGNPTIGPTSRTRRVRGAARGHAGHERGRRARRQSEEEARRATHTAGQAYGSGPAGRHGQQALLARARGRAPPRPGPAGRTGTPARAGSRWPAGTRTPGASRRPRRAASCRALAPAGSSRAPCSPGRCRCGRRARTTRSIFNTSTGMCLSRASEE